MLLLLKFLIRKEQVQLLTLQKFYNSEGASRIATTSEFYFSKSADLMATTFEILYQVINQFESATLPENIKINQVLSLKEQVQKLGSNL